jgi:hypothetical protein
MCCAAEAVLLHPLVLLLSLTSGPGLSSVTSHAYTNPCLLLLVLLLAVGGCVLLQEGHIRVGKLNLVDLAGSERQSKTGATGGAQEEMEIAKQQQCRGRGRQLSSSNANADS